jgi:hypothetical protein
LFSISEITMNFAVYGVHSTHVPKIYVCAYDLYTYLWKFSIKNMIVCGLLENDKISRHYNDWISNVRRYKNF